MIGVAIDSAILPWAAEFFELFKTPWEPAVRGRRYGAVIAADGCNHSFDAQLVLTYGSDVRSVDDDLEVRVGQLNGPVEVRWDERRFPVYGHVATFAGDTEGGILNVEGGPVDYLRRSNGQTVRRIGYDLFGEVRHLLTSGQPAPHASTPTLELHIDLLRHCLREAAIPYVEIPPRPAGYEFVCCLTHDVDFFGIRRHTFDRTLLGFVQRGTVGTLIDLARRRRTVDEALRNWLAVLSLPLVHFGIARDFWHPFRDYDRADQGGKSTFFLAPFKGRPGLAPDGTANSVRALPYAVGDIREEIEQAVAPTTELAVHGIDAWHDSDAGEREMNELVAVTGQTRAGVRMHWLYYSADSPKHLEAAGFDYDSTWGYNDAIGYRAGTSQVFRLPDCERLLELPMSIMDSALFYSGRMGMSRGEALERCGAIVKNASRYGGTLTINWHDRSLAPERQWSRSYRDLMDEVVKAGRVWFATASEAVDWFRWRRTIKFAVDAESKQVIVKAPEPRAGLPGARLALRRIRNGSDFLEEFPFTGATQRVEV